MANKTFLAADLGASGGRLVAGLFDGSKLALEEVTRFPNGGIEAAGRLHWDLLALWGHLQDGLRSAGTRYGNSISSVGVDTWGVDYGLLGPNDELLGNPYHYRDQRTEGMLERVLEIIPRDEIFQHTGLQFLPFNTLYQLYAAHLANPRLLEFAERMLMMPDLFHWLLTGVKSNELTNASTTQFYNPTSRRWATDLLDQLGIPPHLLGDLIEPGTTLGPLTTSVAEEAGLQNVQVVAPGTHDTASAVMAVPARSVASEKPDWCYISSGTWALMGIETPKPVLTSDVQSLNFTNEAGVGGTTRLLKNITGLWLVQECRRQWSREGKNYSWDQLTEMSEPAQPLVSFIDPDHPDFAAPGNMPEAIRAFCQRTGQKAPQAPGEVIRCALESLALKSRVVLEGLEKLIGGKLDTVHIVGGGTQNRLLCKLTAAACTRRVVTGPVEATAIGNILVQLMAAGEVKSAAEAREVVRRSFPVAEFEPRDRGAWDDAYSRFDELLHSEPVG